MRLKEIIVEMSNAVRKDSSSPNTNRYFNIGQGKLGYVLNQTGENAFYPSVDRSQFNSAQELRDAIKQIESKVGDKIVWTNPESLNNARAFGVLKLYNENNKVVYVGKLLQSNHTMIDNNKHKHDPNDSHPNKFDTAALTKLGYVYGGAKSTQYDVTKLRELSNIAIKTKDWTAYNTYLSNLQNKSNNVDTQPSTKSKSYGFEPSDVLNQLANLSISDVVSQVEKKYQNSIPSLVEVTKLVAAGNPGPYPLPDMPVNKFATQFCEILQPLAIASGGLPIEGYDIKNTVLSFNPSKSEKGVDSQLVNSLNQILRVSTKKGKGFASSIEDFGPAIENNLNPNEKQYYKNEILVLQTIIKSPITPNKNNVGALQLAVDLDLISDYDAKYIANLYTKQNNKDYKASAGEDFKIPDNAPESVIKMINLGKKNSKHGLHPYYNALYYVMTMLAEKLNSNQRMKDLLKLLYKRSNTVLISTKLSKNSFIFARKNADINITAKPGYTSDWANKRLSFEIT